MIDLFTIISRGGIVLWYFQRSIEIKFTQPINSLIKSVILQERSGSHIYEAHKLSFKFDNEFDLIFIVGYQRMLQLSYIDKLLDQVSLAFRDENQNQLRANVLMGKYDFSCRFKDILKMCEIEVIQSKQAPREMKSFQESNKSKKTIESLKKTKGGDKAPSANTPNGTKPVKNEPKNHEKPANQVESVPEQVEPVVNGNGVAENGEGGLTEEARKRNLELLRARKAGGGKNKENNKPVGGPAGAKQKGKDARVWPYGGSNVNEKDLDYSKPVAVSSDGDKANAQNGVSETGTTVGSMKGELKGLDEKQPVQNGATENNKGGAKGGKKGGLFGVFSGLVSGKVLSPEDLEGPLEKMREHLIGKNVASEVAEELCNSVSQKLDGKTIGSFSTIANTIRGAMEESLTHILSPKTRIDMLRDALSAKRAGRPYVVTFCGVNGVGKSTNLAKICFWLIENDLRVLIAGCDTFRAGAVEQLKTHCRALNNLHPPDAHSNKIMVQLYEKGYGKDAAHIAQEAINYARSTKFDVVLVDTAGRMQDNEPLMRALTKLISVNSPDLVLFVGEALVGNEAIDQLVKFNKALADFSSSADTKPHCIDAIVLTKFDTIDDKVGACVSMTHITGQPILFVGTGQTYTDLKNLNVSAVVNSLLK